MTLLEICEGLAALDDEGKDLPTLEDLCSKFPDKAADIVDVYITYVSAANRERRRLFRLLYPRDGAMSSPARHGISAVKRKMKI